MIVLKGKERRALRDQIAFARAQFEIEYDGQRIVAFDREAVVRAIPQTYRAESQYPGDRGTITINVSDAFVRECQARVAYMRRLIEEHQ
jgi:hypothetical protein